MSAIINSPAFLVVASAALFVLLFRDGETADDQWVRLTPSGSDTKWLEINTTRLVGGKISCVLALKRDDYTVVPGVGAYKIHTRQTTWNAARKICLAEGGRLAVIDSRRKYDLFLEWKRQRDNVGLWLGVHDLFEEDAWVTVSGESMDTIGYYPWAPNEPNDDGGQDCAVLWMSGMDDYSCTRYAGFICEINLCETLGHRVYDKNGMNVA